MASPQSLWRGLAQIPDLAKGWLVPGGSDGASAALLQYSTRDLDNDRRRATLRSLHYPAGDGALRGPPAASPFPFELPPGTLKLAPSPSGALLAVLSKGKRGKGGKETDCHLDVWSGGVLERSVALAGRELVTDAWFGGLSWSPDERFVLFVAECLRPKKAGPPAPL